MTHIRVQDGTWPGYLSRAAEVEAALEHAGLGRLDWIGPEWILWLSELDAEVVRFLSEHIRHDLAGRMAIRRSRTPDDRHGQQIDALREGLVTCAERQHRDLGDALRFLDGCVRGRGAARAT
jgi:hypothetical protein